MGHYAPMPRGRWVLTSLDSKQDGSRDAGIGRGGVSSLEDLGMTMDLPGDVVERLRGRVVCIPR